MKRSAWILLSLALLLSAGCKHTGAPGASEQAAVTPTPAVTATPAPLASQADMIGGDRAALLSGYPGDILPLYKCVKVTDCSFEMVQSDQEFLLGSDVYTVSYTTGATESEIVSFYNQFVVPMDEIAFADSLEGKVGDNPVDITLDIEKDMPLAVTLQIGLTTQQQPASNPYFANYSGTVAVPSDKNTPYSTIYRNFYESERLTVEYVQTYVSTMTVKQFTSLYTSAFGKEAGFQKQEDSYGKSFTFTKDNSAWLVSLTKNGQSAGSIYLTIVCDSL